MLTHKHIIKLENPHFTAEHIHWYWHQLKDSTITTKQTKLLIKLADMSKKEQQKYVIVDNELVKSPTNKVYYSSLSGKWQPTGQFNAKRTKK